MITENASIDVSRLEEILTSLEFIESTHTYFWKARETLSSTQILDLAGITDYSKVPIDILERAREFGDAVHLTTRYADEGRLNLPALDPFLIPRLNAWEKFKADRVKKIILIEQKIYCPVGPFCGTLDRLYINKSGELCLLEIKSTNDFMSGVELQTASYHYALEKLLKIKIKRREAVLLHDDDYEPFEFKNKSDIDKFMAAVVIANYKKTKRRF